MDIIAEMQHRDRIAVHDVKNIQAVARNALHLYGRDGNYQCLIDALASIIIRTETIKRDLGSPVKERTIRNTHADATKGFLPGDQV